jgi:hypothetical protein
MNNPVDEGMREVWEWKRRAEEATRGMNRAELIEFYRREADEVERRWGLNLKRQDPADVAQTRARA